MSKLEQQKSMVLDMSGGSKNPDAIEFGPVTFLVPGGQGDVLVIGDLPINLKTGKIGKPLAHSKKKEK